MHTPARAPTTTTAGLLAVAVSLGWGAFGVGEVVDGSGSLDDARDAESGLVGLVGSGVGLVRIVAGVLILACATCGGVVGVATLRRWRGARTSGIVTFAAFGGLAVIHAAIAAGDDADRAAVVMPLLTVGLDLAIVVLLALRSTRRDLERVAAWRAGGRAPTPSRSRILPR
jgi:hypothetical protein